MKKLTIRQVGLVLFFTIVLLSWFKSDKLASYWQQEYDNSEPFNSIANSSVGKAGNSIGELGGDNNIEDGLKTVNDPINQVANQVFYQQELEKDRLLQIQKEQALLEAKLKSVTEEQEKKSQELQPKIVSRIYLEDGKKALFIGDSLMQGVAPWVMRKLQNDYHIDSIDLSKHSTGLTVSKFFDWPATVEKTLAENPDINALFVFLGGNDGQSIIDPNTNRHIRFASERWDEIYAGKIQRILDTAKAYKVQVLWIAPPNMKSPSLNKRTAHLSHLYGKSIPNSRAVMLYSKEILQLDTAKDTYSDSMLINGKLRKVRTADGVHFTTRGQKVLANALMEKIDINQKPMLSVSESY